MCSLPCVFLVTRWHTSISYHPTWGCMDPMQHLASHLTRLVEEALYQCWGDKDANYVANDLKA